MKQGSLAASAYGKVEISERHRHRYELNDTYKAEFENAGMVFSGFNPESGLAEIIELPANKWYLGTQFHPEYSSTVENPHPLFKSFIAAAMR